ncbi:MAG: c-type cytochrome [Thermoanaerobaculia bacterium]
MPLRRLFAISSLLFLAILAISPAKNALRPYRSFQRQFARLGVTRAKSQKAAREYESRPVAIRQIWMKEFDNRVDRCTTCHLGVADPLMTAAPEPLRTHPRTAHTPDGFEKIGCTSCHGGQGLATSEEEAHGFAKDAGPPMTPAMYIESGCGRCHGSESVPGAPLLSRGRALMSRFSCFACHLVRGQESFRSEAPPIETLPLKTGGEWVRRWLKNPHAIDPNATMPNFQLSDGEIDELANALFARPVPEGLAGAIQKASEEPPGSAGNGKKIFSESRCISCHTVEGKGNGTAPELSKVASAATRGWLLAFLRSPQSFNPKTRMPRYGFSETESRDIVAFLEEEFRDFDAPKEILEPLRPNQTVAERGEKLFRRLGCFACHGPLSGSDAERFGPTLDGVGDKKPASLDFGKRVDLPRTLPAWLAAKLEVPRSFAQGLKMPSFGFSPEDSRAIVTALLALEAEPVPEAYRYVVKRPPAVLPGGETGQLIDRYRCLSCHQVGDRGGDISTAPLTYEGSKVRREWLVDYLVLSTSIRPILEERMPIFRMSREEATRLADAMESFWVDAAIPEDPFAGKPSSDADPREGQRLYAELGCRSCHLIGSAGGGYYGPPLTDTANRLKPGWIYHWLKGPQRWRADVRCPDYGLRDTDALRLTAYLETLKAPPEAKVAGGKR